VYLLDAIGLDYFFFVPINIGIDTNPRDIKSTHILVDPESAVLLIGSGFILKDSLFTFLTGSDF
jgi:hypothetical protein